MFFHYPPQFYHLHAHFTSLAVEGPGCLTERAVLLDDGAARAAPHGPPRLGASARRLMETRPCRVCANVIAVIDALERDPEHFAKCSLTVRAGEGDPLMKALSAAQAREAEGDGGR